MLAGTARPSTPEDSVTQASISMRPVAPRVERELLQRGAQIGRFLVLEPVGSGGMGVVYAALDPLLQRKVAVKLLRSAAQDQSSPGSHDAGLIREAQALARLTHPNVTAAYEVGQCGARTFVAMEFVEGFTLKTWLKQRSRSPQEILDVFLQAGSGLAAAHEAGLVHRDFKPENVLIGKDGRVRVTDFGLARTVRSDTADENELGVLLGTLNEKDVETTHGRFSGTPRYMAPEQLDGSPASERTDMFSFSVALYQALYGRHPFGLSLKEIILGARAGQVHSPPRGVPMSREVHRVILRGLSRRPEERFPSMKALMTELQQARTAGRSWGRPLQAGVIATVMIALLGVGVTTALVRAPRPTEGELPRSASAPVATVASPDPRPVVTTAAVEPVDPPPPSRPEARPQRRMSTTQTAAASKSVARKRTAKQTVASAAEAGQPVAGSLLVPARLTLVSKPAARVIFNGQSLGTTPLSNVRLPAGSHTLRLVAVDGRTYLLPLQLVGGLISTREVELESLQEAPRR